MLETGVQEGQKKRLNQVIADQIKAEAAEIVVDPEVHQQTEKLLKYHVISVAYASDL